MSYEHLPTRKDAVIKNGLRSARARRSKESLVGCQWDRARSKKGISHAAHFVG